MPEQSSADVILRPFRPDDLPALVDVYMAAYRDFPEYGEPDEAHALRYLQWLQRHHTLFFIAEVEGRPVGFIVVDANWRDWKGRRIGEIHELAVHPEYWGRSIARRLLDAAMNHIRAEGCSRPGYGWACGTSELRVFTGASDSGVQENPGARGLKW